MERTTDKAKALRARSTMLRHYSVKPASRIAFGNQTIFLPSRWTKVEDSRLCVPTSRQVCLFGAFKDQWWTLGIIKAGKQN